MSKAKITERTNPDAQERPSNSRLAQLLLSGKIDRSCGGAVFLDCYHQTVHHEYAETVTTRINSSALYWVIEPRDKRNGLKSFVMETNDKKDMNRADSMEFKKTDDGGIKGVRANNGLTASEWQISGEGADVSPNIRAKDEAKVTERRKDSIRFKALPNGNIRGFQDDGRKSGCSELCICTEKSEGSYAMTTQGQVRFTDGVRIRRLTPSECLRLMDVSEKDIKTMTGCGISDSQLYKMAGNSIVVNVLAKIFESLLTDKAPDEGTQLKLF